MAKMNKNNPMTNSIEKHTYRNKNVKSYTQQSFT